MKRMLLLFLTASFITLAGQTQQIDTLAKERLKQHVCTLASDTLQGRQAGTIYARKAADYIAKQFEEIGIEPYFGNSYLQYFKRNDKYQNVVGVIRGSDPVLKNEFIVVGAHYDHNGKNYNGADDNASGTAAMIEIGRALKHNQSNLKRSVMFIAFDAEEIGLIGSSHFAFKSEAEIENIKLMISLDMIGHYKANGKLQLLGSGTIKNGNEMLLSPHIVPLGLHIVIKDFEYSPFYGTDTQPFAQKRIPTIWAFTGLKSPFHTPKDKAHLIDYDGMTLITEYLVNLVETVSRDTDFEPSGKLSKKHKPRERVEYGVSANIGSTMPHENDKDNKTVAMSFGAGFMSQVNFGCFAVRPELHYDHIRARHPSGTIATDNLTVPLSLVLQTPEYLFFGGDIFFGGYYSYRLSGKQGKQKIDFENTFNRGEAGLTFGLSINYKPFKAGVNCRVALTDFTKSTNVYDAHIRNKTLYITLTYMF